MDVDTNTPTKATPEGANVTKLTSPISSKRLDSAEKQRKHREVVAERRRTQDEDFKISAAASSASKLERAAERKKNADNAKRTRASRETVKLEQSRSRSAWATQRRVRDTAAKTAAKTESAAAKAEKYKAETVNKAKAFNQRVEDAQRRKAEQEEEFKQRAKDAYEIRMKLKGPAEATAETDNAEAEAEAPMETPKKTELEEGEIDEEAEVKEILAKLKLLSPAERMANAEERRSALKRRIQQDAARHNVKAQQIQARTAWDRKRKENELRVEIAAKSAKAAKLVSTPVRGSKAAKHNEHVTQVHANAVAAAEQQREELMKQMQERQKIAGERRLKALTPSPPKRARKRVDDAPADQDEGQRARDRMEQATKRRDEILMQKKAKAAWHNMSTKQQAAQKVANDVNAAQANREGMEERIRNARQQRAMNLRLRQEKARVDNQHKAFIAETAGKIQDANRINEAVSNKIDQLQAFARREDAQKQRVAFAARESKAVAERVKLNKQLRYTEQECDRLKLDNDQAQAEVKRMQMLQLRSLEAQHRNAYKRDVARLHYDYAEAAKANQLEELERRQNEAAERRRMLMRGGNKRSRENDDEETEEEEVSSEEVSSDEGFSKEDDLDALEQSITDFGRRLFNIALQM